jgi:hypothetical protein
VPSKPRVRPVRMNRRRFFVLEPIKHVATATRFDATRQCSDVVASAFATTANS